MEISTIRDSFPSPSCSKLRREENTFPLLKKEDERGF